MEKYSFIANLFVYSVIPTLLFLYITERVKGSVKNSFDKKLEEVKTEHSKEISQFQIELNHLKSKDNFKFTKLHEKRLKILQKTYFYIIESIDLLEKYISDYEVIRDEKTSNLSVDTITSEYTNLYIAFTKYSDINAIYFSEEIKKLINDYIEEGSSIYINYVKKYNSPIIMVFSDEDLNELINESSKLIEHKLIPLKKQIEIKFRELLGE
nr:hypothetical protein [uncultured Flavobacterium sp.]